MKGAQLLSLLVRNNQFVRQKLSCRQCILARNRLLPVCVNMTPFSTSSQACQAESASSGLWSKIRFDLGFISGLKYPKSVLNLSGFRMYICCTELIDYTEFFSEFDLPDTFYSWFLVTDLHIWFCMVRLASLGKDGRLLRNCLVKALWEDVEARSKQLGSAASLTARKEGVRQMADLFHASLFSYDEGLLGDDKELAGGLWRVFFEMNHDLDPHKLELLVAYVRKQVAHIDSQTEESILGRGFVTFLPLRGDKIDERSARRQALTVGKLRTKV
ncbi:ubiquinol-cytochrome-c reductase complex assembly factor 1-like [Littorina saxatilis]|uniref:Ubiquinol-cytochrome c chaperone domain-containing protein n=1 Tax=Littorina saxatilis TaxID=31220 RepID=A0AAN9ANL6_9CAEN